MSDTLLFPTPARATTQVSEVAPIPPRGLPAGRAVSVAAVEARTALTRQKRAGDGHGRRPDWSAHPYRGCESGCGYCSARTSHGSPGHGDPEGCEHTVYVKRGFARALREDLRRRVQPGEHIAFGAHPGLGDHLGLGEATDPYQALERRERVTRAALREIARAEGLRVSITTRSTLITRDLDVLRRVAERHALHVNVAVTTIDRRLARLLEPRAPEPRARLRAVRALRRAGISCGLFVTPLLPGITDAEADLVALLREAREAGAQWVGSQVVFLREPSRSLFVRRLRAGYPRVAARYEVWSRYRSRLPERLRDESLDRLSRHARRLGLASSPRCDLPAPARPRQATFGFALESS